MISRYELTEDYTDYLLKGDAFQQMMKRRSDAFFAVKGRPHFILPEHTGDYHIGPGDWINGTGHHAQWQYLIVKRSVCAAKDRFSHWSWCNPTGVPHIPDVDVINFIAYRIDDYLKFNGQIHNDHYSYFGGYLSLDDCLTEITNHWSPVEKIWRIPEPEAARAIRLKKNSQLTLFDLL